MGLDVAILRAFSTYRIFRKIKFRFDYRGTFDFQSAPYVMRKEASEKLTGNAQFEGYAVDLIHEISRVLGFNYTIRLTPDGQYGSQNRDTKEWNGMIGELLNQKADLAIADLTITYEREQAVDFTMPFMNLGISILYRKPIKQPPNLFSFLSPLSLDVWIYMATAYLGVSVLLFILARYFKYKIILGLRFN